MSPVIKVRKVLFNKKEAFITIVFRVDIIFRVTPNILGIVAGIWASTVGNVLL